MIAHESKRASWPTRIAPWVFALGVLVIVAVGVYASTLSHESTCNTVRINNEIMNLNLLARLEVPGADVDDELALYQAKLAVLEGEGCTIHPVELPPSGP